jgi:hypothetical protein
MRALFRREQFVDEDVAVVPDDTPADTAIVVLAFNALTAAGVAGFFGDDHLFVVVFEFLAIDDAAAGSFLTGKVSVRVHASPLFQRTLGRDDAETTAVSLRPWSGRRNDFPTSVPV